MSSRTPLSVGTLLADKEAVAAAAATEAAVGVDLAVQLRAVARQEAVVGPAALSVNGVSGVVRGARLLAVGVGRARRWAVADIARAVLGALGWRTPARRWAGGGV